MGGEQMPRTAHWTSAAIPFLLSRDEASERAGCNYGFFASLPLKGAETMTDRVQTVEQLYAAFAAGDASHLEKQLADTEWVEAAGMPYGGTYRGFGEIAANVFGPITNDVQGFSVRPDEIIPAGEDKVLALGTYRGSGSAGEVSAPFAHLWTVRDGRISNFVQYADTHLFRQAIGA
jgi:ketosteroid isomerase-like protein